MADTESSALIRFIASSQEPIRKSNRQKAVVPNADLVLAPLKKRWKLKVFGGLFLILAGVVAGLAASGTRPGRWVATQAGWVAPTPEAQATVPEAPAPPAEPPAAAPCPAPAAAPAGPSAEKPAAETVAVAAAAAPAPVEDEKKDKDGKKSKKKDGTLLISSKPACDIVIDGQETGLRTPQRGIKLKPGKHQVVLVNRDFGIKKKLTVKIASGRSTKVVKDLRDPLDE